MSPLLPRIASALLGLSFITSILAFTPTFPYGSVKVRGVNLGGWLVLEPWITPSLFDGTGDSRIVDEWTFGQYQDRAVAAAKLRTHWDTWITEADFAAIADAGLNHVRVPIGYWAFEVGSGEPYIQGQLPYLDKAVQWAEIHGLKVIIDLHGAPGSQNGFDNSGQKMNYPKWHTDSNNVLRTNAVIETIARMFKDKASVVPAVAPLNEPAGFYGQDILNTTIQYWYSSYDSIRYPYPNKERQSNTLVMIHDAFQPLSFWDGFMAAPRYEGVSMDVHYYQIFSVAENQMSKAEHIKTACGKQASLSSFHLGVVVGEWSPAITDCAKYLNGRGVGARYDGSYPGSTRVGSCTGYTGSASTFSQSYKTFLRQFWEAQTLSYEKGHGWIQWTWKAENADEWAYQAGLTHGWIPSNHANRMYPNICD